MLTIRGKGGRDIQVVVESGFEGLPTARGLLLGAPTIQPTMRTLQTTATPTGVGLLSPASGFAGFAQTSLAAPPNPFSQTVVNSTPPRVMLRAA